MTISEMLEKINQMLEGNPRAIRLVYVYLVAFTGGKDNE